MQPFFTLARIFPFELRHRSRMFTRLSEHLIICIRQVFPDDRIPLFLRLRRLVRTLSFFLRSKNRTRIGLALVLLRCPVLWATSMLLAVIGMPHLSLKIAHTSRCNRLQSPSLAPCTLADSTSWSTSVGRSALSLILLDSPLLLFNDACSSFVHFLQRLHF